MTETQREYRKTYRHLPHVREAERISRRKRRENNREAERTRARERYAKNAEKERLRSKKNNERHPERIRKARAVYRRTHADEMRSRDRLASAKFRAALDAFKLQAGCVDCGYKEHPCALDFDHIYGKKVTSPSLCGSITSALKEALKCQVRCANCHRIRTFERRKSAKMDDGKRA
jgi:hypothetical protein